MQVEEAKQVCCIVGIICTMITIISITNIFTSMQANKTNKKYNAIVEIVKHENQNAYFEIREVVNGR